VRAELQQLVLRGKVLSDSRCPLADEQRIGDRRALQTTSSARVGLLEVWRLKRNVSTSRLP
jgi:hypothetical protein